jgi:hypothetical protein
MYSPERECIDNERRQILEEAAELDHIWGAWEAEAEPTNDPNKWLKQPSLSKGDVRCHVEVHASHREQRWEPPSASLIERDPELIPDVTLQSTRTRISSLMKDPETRVRSGVCESGGTFGTVEGKGSLQSVHIPRTNDMHGSRRELDDNEQRIQPRTKYEREGRA